MDKKKIAKKRIPFGSTMKIMLYQELQALSNETDIPISKLLDRAIEMLLSEYKKKSPDNE